MDYIKIAKVNAVQLEKEQATYIGTLHLTAHHLIFSHPEQETWISYPTIHTVEKGLPTLQALWPLQIRCHNFDFVSLNFQSEKDVADVYESVQKLTCIGSVEQLYAFFYQPTPAFTANDGWHIYDPYLEYERMGVGSRSDQWRFSDLNQSYSFSPTYPRLIVVPTKISDTVLQYASKHRSKTRIPALSYLHWNNMASITRSSQPMVGLKQNRSIQDEKLIEAIFLTNIPQSAIGHQVYGSTPTNLIVDARPTVNAVANTASGAGTENMENYRNCKKVYSGIENIHVMRDSLNRLVEALQEIDTKGYVNKSGLQRSGWLKHVSAVMEGALMIVRNIHISNSHVLVHCSDGWDRTAQLTSLAQLCLDPYFRTFRGFQVLVEKEWCSFGYKFMDRCGHLSNDKNFVALSSTSSAANTFANVQNKFLQNNKHIRETSPVFQQFLDCVFQTLHQYPTRFEFNELFLTQLHFHVYSCQFGNFLFNCEKDRQTFAAKEKCCSVWDFFNSNKDEYINPEFRAADNEIRGGDGGVLLPDPKQVRYWAKLFGRTDKELNSLVAAPLGEGEDGSIDPGLGENGGMARELADAATLNLEPNTDGSSPILKPRLEAKVRQQQQRPMSSIGTMGAGGDSDDPWRSNLNPLYQGSNSGSGGVKFPAALSGAFGGGLVDSFNRLTMNVRDTWYANTNSSTGGGPSNASSSSLSLAPATLENPFSDMRASASSPDVTTYRPSLNTTVTSPLSEGGSQSRPQQQPQPQPQQSKTVTLSRNNSGNRRRPTLDTEFGSSSSSSSSQSSGPKHSLAALTLEQEMAFSSKSRNRSRSNSNTVGASGGRKISLGGPVSSMLSPESSLESDLSALDGPLQVDQRKDDDADLDPLRSRVPSTPVQSGGSLLVASGARSNSDPFGVLGDGGQDSSRNSNGSSQQARPSSSSSSSSSPLRSPALPSSAGGRMANEREGQQPQPAQLEPEEYVPPSKDLPHPLFIE